MFYILLHFPVSFPHVFSSCPFGQQGNVLRQTQWTTPLHLEVGSRAPRDGSGAHHGLFRDPIPKSKHNCFAQSWKTSTSHSLPDFQFYNIPEVHLCFPLRVTYTYLHLVLPTKPILYTKSVLPLFYFFGMFCM